MKKNLYGNEDADIVLIQMVDDHDLEYIEREVSVIQENVKRDFCLVALHVTNWNDDLSPWESEAVFGNEGFGGNAEATLKEVLELCTDKSKTYHIGGYSLAGLFALWAAYQTDIFEGVAAASPSIWFPGFVDYMKDHELKAHSVYLSLGDKEEKARNQTMAKVGDCIRGAHEYLQSRGIDVTLEWNQGNHFKDADLRTAKAFSWILNRT
ncbi:esterase [Butyrivibrio sp. CB08]|uniref:esterase n=1 Tax=Butyrivibrio sp. CB08 TaxID=2364879 RepID=UPI000EA9BF59|nr:esterase [Butyrivibrio sp. CB08]RKM61239.1 esterase [Butyrivibrio sp. CB08]